MSALWTAWNKFPFERSLCRLHLVYGPCKCQTFCWNCSADPELSCSWASSAWGRAGVGSRNASLTVPHRWHAKWGKLRCNCLWGHVIFSINITYRYNFFYYVKVGIKLCKKEMIPRGDIRVISRNYMACLPQGCLVKVWRALEVVSDRVIIRH